jgi:hypothetical protein
MRHQVTRRAPLPEHSGSGYTPFRRRGPAVTVCIILESFKGHQACTIAPSPLSQAHALPEVSYLVN